MVYEYNMWKLVIVRGELNLHWMWFSWISPDYGSVVLINFLDDFLIVAYITSYMKDRHTQNMIQWTDRSITVSSSGLHLYVDFIWFSLGPVWCKWITFLFVGGEDAKLF